jgi:hypothetical protein
MEARENAPPEKISINPANPLEPPDGDDEATMPGSKTKEPTLKINKYINVLMILDFNSGMLQMFFNVLMNDFIQLF